MCVRTQTNRLEALLALRWPELLLRIELGSATQLSLLSANLVFEIADAIEAHSQIEEQIFYPKAYADALSLHMRGVPRHQWRWTLRSAAHSEYT